jgi:mannose-6-phosphate isomerase-like protein (cupin superfamily)
MTRSRADVLLRGEDSGGRIALVEMKVEAGFAGPPKHTHELWDEGFYVVEGEVAIQVAEQTLMATPGMFAFAPRTVPHTFANPGDKDARMLVLLTPAGFERYIAGEEDRKSGAARVAAWIRKADR